MFNIQRLCVCILVLLIATLTACDSTATQSPLEISIPVTSPPSQEAKDHYFQIVELVLTDLDDFWSDEFAGVWSNRTYSSPKKLLPYTKENLGAIDAKWLNNAFYDHPTKTLAWDEDWLWVVNDEFTRENDMGPIAILAHEWGHHIQNLTQRLEVSVQNELQADCYAGVYISHLNTQGRLITLEVSDVKEAAITFFRIGDKGYNESNWFDPTIHGSPTERMFAFSRGFLSGDPNFCITYEDYTFRKDLVIGDYRLNLPPAIQLKQAHQNGLIELQSTACTVQLRVRPELGSASASQQFDAVMKGWLGETNVITRSKPLDASFAIFQRGTAVGQKYEQYLANTQETVHGILFLHIKPAGGGFIMDVFANGATPTDDGDWDKLESCLFITLYGLSF